MKRNATKRKDAPKRKADRCYSTHGIAVAVTRGCVRAKVPHWHPNQLHHLFATEVRRVHGLEAAQVLLGHASADTTEIYAERNLALAAEIG